MYDAVMAKTKKTGLSTKGKSMGGSMGGAMETTKGYRKRAAAKRKAEETYWQSLNGPVITYKKSQEVFN
jgi:hypothetical protein